MSKSEKVYNFDLQNILLIKIVILGDDSLILK